mgnify:CR=1 FL=1
MPKILLALTGLMLALVAGCTPAPAAHGGTDGSAAHGGTDGPAFVSLNPCLDALLVEIAAPRQILALSHYSRDASSSSLAPVKATG